MHVAMTPPEDKQMYHQAYASLKWYDEPVRRWLGKRLDPVKPSSIEVYNGKVGDYT
ncbi:hypothetical protein HX021_01050 [Sphingobacterium sp. N143]|uniref:hypothetical protein n=1 Tax=Sphingobacterium sp. N143 TaxID=2746727 RepID=UPI0025788B17|nr:hypothetical protein [Sphingobacterium sp. N143]MDM1292880.1 hypothetical protein [Sphingobacterium sp. N143]